MKKTGSRILRKSTVTVTRLILRSAFALCTLILYIFDREKLDFNADGKLFSASFLSSPFLTIVFFFWFFDLLLRLFPLPYTDMAFKKSFACGYLEKAPVPEKGARSAERSAQKEESLRKRFFRRIRMDGFRSLLLFFVANSLYFIPYILVRTGVVRPMEWQFLPEFIKNLIAKVGTPELMLVTMIYYVLDIVFIRFWCIFRDVLNKNRCCTTCRISCWDGFLCYTPMLLCPLTLFSLPLLILSYASMIRFEISLARHPERFDERRNALLSCANCQNDVCPRRVGGRKK